MNGLWHISGLVQRLLCLCRLKDLANEGVCNLGNVRHLVLDEADRMLDMGFEEDVQYIISRCPAPRGPRPYSDSLWNS